MNRLDKNEIVNLYTLEGQTQEDIADKLDISQPMVSKYLKDLGVKTRPRGRPSKISDETVKKFVELYEEGWTIKEISERYGVYRTTVSKKLKEKGLKLRRRGRKISLNMIMKWVGLYEEGLTQKEIAEMYDVCQGTVSNKLREQGIKGRWLSLKKNIPDDVLEQWERLYKQGVSLTEITRIYGVSYKTVSSKLTKKGVLPIKKDTKEIKDELVEEWVSLYKSGLTQKEIAERYDISPTKISEKLREKNVQIRRGRPNEVSEEDVNLWIDLYNEGETLKNIAEKYNVSLGTVSNKLRARNVHTRGRGKKIKKEVVKQWIELYERGESMKEIAKKYNVAVSTVWKKLKAREETIKRLHK